MNRGLCALAPTRDNIPRIRSRHSEARSRMLLVLDNYDSFTFNLVQLLGALGADPVVVRNDERSVEEILSMDPARVVVSPGPCTPSQAGVSVDAFRTLGRHGIPMLGVCLGHQSLGEAFGGHTVRARRTVHGKIAPVRHDGDLLFEGIPSPFMVARYHSLVTDAEALPDELEPIAWSMDPSDASEIQGMRHRERPLRGVQFHPESLFSEHGERLLANFLAWSP
jgi:anthranilate synthase component 2